MCVRVFHVRDPAWPQMKDRINYLVETCRLPSLPATRLRQLADIFSAAVGVEFLSNPPTKRDPISGRARVRHRLLRMLASSKDATFAVSELAEVGLYLETFASDSQIRACVDGLRNDYESTLFQLAMAYRLCAAGCTTVHLEPETARGRADVAFTYDGIPFVAECYRLSKGLSDYFAEAQHALYDRLLELVPPGTHIQLYSCYWPPAYVRLISQDHREVSGNRHCNGVNAQPFLNRPSLRRACSWGGRYHRCGRGS